MVLDPAFSTGRLPRSGILSLPPSDTCLSNRIRSEPHQASACLRPHCIICIRGMHNMHFRGIPACIICIFRMHNMHQTRAQYAYGAVRTAAPRTARQADPLAFTHGHRKTNSPARGNPEKTGGRLAAAPSHIQSGLAARLPAKRTPIRRRVGVLTVWSSHDMRRLPGRAASISRWGGGGSSRPERRLVPASVRSAAFLIVEG